MIECIDSEVIETGGKKMCAPLSTIIVPKDNMMPGKKLNREAKFIYVKKK